VGLLWTTDSLPAAESGRACAVAILPGSRRPRWRPTVSSARQGTVTDAFATTPNLPRASVPSTRNWPQRRAPGLATDRRANAVVRANSTNDTRDEMRSHLTSQSAAAATPSGGRRRAHVCLQVLFRTVCCASSCAAMEPHVRPGDLYARPLGLHGRGITNLGWRDGALATSRGQPATLAEGAIVARLSAWGRPAKPA
jgi:hypothetical protein